MMRITTTNAMQLVTRDKVALVLTIKRIKRNRTCMRCQVRMGFCFWIISKVELNGKHT
jgi:hypothetical protein